MPQEAFSIFGHLTDSSAKAFVTSDLTTLMYGATFHTICRIVKAVQAAAIDGIPGNSPPDSLLTGWPILCKDDAMRFESMSKGFCAMCCCQRCAHVSSGMGRAGSLS
jgi:hypothetical protein